MTTIRLFAAVILCLTSGIVARGQQPRVSGIPVQSLAQANTTSNYLATLATSATNTLSAVQTAALNNSSNVVYNFAVALNGGLAIVQTAALNDASNFCFTVTQVASNALHSLTIVATNDLSGVLRTFISSATNDLAGVLRTFTITATNNGASAARAYADAATNALDITLRALIAQSTNTAATTSYVNAATNALDGVLRALITTATNNNATTARAYTDAATNALETVLRALITTATNNNAATGRSYADSTTNALDGVLRALVTTATNNNATTALAYTDAATNSLAGVVRAYADSATNALAAVVRAYADASTNALSGVLRTYTETATNDLNTVLRALWTDASMTNANVFSSASIKVPFVVNHLTGSTNNIFEVRGSNNTRVVFVSSNGNFSIGTAVPFGKFQIGSPTGANTNINSLEANIYGAYGTFAPTLTLFSTNASSTDRGGSIGFAGENGQALTPYLFGQIKAAKEAGGTYNGYLSFSTTAASSSVTERVRVSSTGNVGVGTNGPTERLHIHGNVIIRSNVVINGSIDVRTNISQMDVIITNWVIGQRYTNTVAGGYDSRRATVSGTIVCNSAVAGNGQCSLYVEHGTAYTNKLTVAAGGVATLVNKESLMLRISPGDFFRFTDESTGTGSISFEAGTGSWVGE